MRSSTKKEQRKSSGKAERGNLPLSKINEEKQPPEGGKASKKLGKLKEELGESNLCLFFKIQSMVGE